MQVTVSDKGQITLPQALRRQLGIEPGSQLEIDRLDDGTLLVRKLTRGADGLAGLLSRPGEAARTLSEMEQAVTEAASERAAVQRRARGA